MSFQEEESDSHYHPVVRRMALFHLSSLRSPGDALMKQLVRVDAGFCFLIRNSSLCLAFLLMVDGLDFFFLAWVSEASTFVSRVKEKLEPTVRENLNAKPWLLSIWQKSRHLVAKLVSLTAVIF